MWCGNSIVSKGQRMPAMRRERSLLLEGTSLRSIRKMWTARCTIRFPAGSAARTRASLAVDAHGISCVALRSRECRLASLLIGLCVSSTLCSAAVPGAPTIGTASPGNATAIVTFSAPSSDGGAAITGYTATSSPGGIAGTSSTSFPGALLHFDGTNGSTTFTDVQGHSFSSGNGAALSTSQLKFGTASLDLNGSNQSISTASSTDFDLQSDFTIEAWIYYNTVNTSVAQALISRDNGGGSNNKWGFGLNVLSAGNFSLHRNTTSGTQYNLNWPWSPSASTWYHLAIVRQANSWTVYVNGTSLGTLTDTNPMPLTTAPLVIGALGEGLWYTNGYIDELRIAGGTAVYTANFTPPTAPLSPVAQAGPIIVNGLTNGTAYTFSVKATNASGTGSASAASNSVTPAAAPLPGAPVIGTATAGSGSATVTYAAPISDGGSAITGYTATSSPGGIVGTSSAVYPGVLLHFDGANGGTAFPDVIGHVFSIAGGAPVTSTSTEEFGSASLLPGSNGYISTAGTNDWVFAGDYTMEMWQYVQNTTDVRRIMGQSSWQFHHNGHIYFYDGAWRDLGAFPGTNVWYHVAVTRQGASCYGFVNGSLVATWTNSASFGSNAEGLWIGHVNGSVEYAPNMYVDEIRIVNGTAVYTASFTPPSAPLAPAAQAIPIIVIGLTGGNSYTFTVTATNAGGVGPASASSNIVIPGAATAPGAPSVTSIHPSNGQVTVTFSVAVSNGSPITGYTVTASPSGGVDGNAGTTSLSHLVTGLTNGTPYTFTVKATNALGTGPASPPSNSATPATVPGPPTIGAATAGNASATVAFTVPSSNGGAVITSYTASSAPGGITGTASTSPISVTGLTAGTAYTFTVTASNLMGSGAASAATNSVTPTAATAPGAPMIGTAIAGNTSATVSFLAPASNGGSAISSFTATSTPGSLTGSGAASPIVVAGLTNGTSYTFKVTATNAVGVGTASASSNSVTPTAVPGPPTIGTATVGNASATVSFAAPFSTGASAITQYTVTSSPGGLAMNGTTSPITVSGLTNGTAYTFTVTATNASGTGLPSAASNSVTPAVATAVPGAPTIGTASGGNSSATVSFTPPTNTGGRPVISYTVTSNPGGIVGLGTTSPVTVSGLTNGTPYTFTVTATNAIGIGSASGASNSVTPSATGTVPGAPTIGTATAGSGQVTVSFTPPTNNGGSPITSYKVTSAPGALSGSASASPVTVTGLSNGTAYTFTVTATNATGTSAASAASNSVTPVAGVIQFHYDAAGRLTEVIDASGNSAQYAYDAAGNITSITRNTGTAVAISDVEPIYGQAGNSISIDGTGFSTTPSSNSVKFNGVSATVVSATPSQLVVTVPAGATTGPISVIVGSSSATTPYSFTITSSLAPPTITSFSPTIAAVAAPVTISGTNFDTVTTNDSVYFDGIGAPVTAATPTSLTALVPAYAASGPISISTWNGSATSTTDFYVLPPGVVASQVGVTQRTTVNATPLVVNIPAGQQALILFNGVQGQNLGLAVALTSTTPAAGSVSVAVQAPSRQTTLINCGIDYAPPGGYYPAGAKCVLPPLPVTGSYSIQVATPAGQSASLTLTLASEVTGTLVANAAPTTFSTARVGQNARYTFSGTAGESGTVTWSGTTFPVSWTSGSIVVTKPDASQLSLAYFDNSSSNASGSIVLPDLPETGTYTVWVVPPNLSTGQISVGFEADASGALTVNGSASSLTLAAGQSADYNFSGTQGQNLGLGVNITSTTPAGGSVTTLLMAPDRKTTLIGCGITYAPSNGYYPAGGKCALPALPSTGTYTVRVITPGDQAASLALTLSTEVTGTLVANAAATTFSTTRVGQNARYTFSGTVGQNGTVTWSGTTFPVSWTSGSIVVYKPDGSQLSLAYFDNSTGNASGSIVLPDLPETGTYTVWVVPPSLSTGQISVGFDTDAGGTLTLNAAPLTVTLVAGQSADYTFSGTQGQYLGLGVNITSTTPAGGSVTTQIIAPDKKTVVIGCGSTYAPSNGYYPAGGKCNLPALPSTGTYTVRVVTPGDQAASLALTLSTEVTGTLVANAAATTFSTTRVGQNARYTFSGTALQNASLVWSATTFPVSWTSGTMYVYKPDGSQLTSAIFDNSGNASGTITLNDLPETGSYTVWVVPPSLSTGQIKIQYLQSGSYSPGSETVNGTISVSGTALNINQAAGTTYNYTFSGTQGQQLGLGVSSVTTTPSNGSGYIGVTVIAPDNATTVINCGGFGPADAGIGGATATGSKCNLPPLPSTGTYTIRVSPAAGYSATATLTLSGEATGTLVANATPTLFSTTRVGQNARYSFSGTIGQNISVAWSSSTFSAGGQIYVYEPDGTQLGTATFGADNYIALTSLTETGTYTVWVVPTSLYTGQVNVALTADASNTLTVNGSVLNANLAEGQSADYTFSGTAGQNLSLGISTVVTNPSNNYGYVGVTVLAPDGVTTLINCGGFGLYYNGVLDGGKCSLPPLPSTGTYTVRVSPASGYSATATLTLSADATGTLVANAAPTLFSTTRVGQNARYTFSATVGQNIAIAWSGSTFTAGGQVYVYQPDGIVLSNVTFSGDSYIALTSILETGTYTVWVVPSGPYTGQVNVALYADATNTLAVNGAVVNASLAEGQSADYTFSGTIGQNLGLGVSSVVTTPSNGYGYFAVTVIDPDGATTLINCGGFGPYNDGTAAGSKCSLPPLPSTGTYTVRVSPASGYSATATLTLSGEVTGALVANTAPTPFSTTRVGQNARYSFSGTIGQNVTVAWNGSTFASGGQVYVYQPDGSLLTNVAFSTDSFVALSSLLETGTYTVWVVPSGVWTGQVNLRLGLDAPGSLATDGTPYDVSLLAWQNGSFTFTGSVGQALTLTPTNALTVPANQPVGILVLAPDGLTTIANCNVIGPCPLLRLTVPGTYTVRVLDSGNYTTTLTLSLQ